MMLQLTPFRERVDRLVGKSWLAAHLIGASSCIHLQSGGQWQ
jgi:hypothetical protein